MLATDPTDILSSLLGSRARSGLIETLVAHPDESWSIRGAATNAGIDPKSCWNEMARLHSMGLVRAQKFGQSLRYQWNREHPAAAHLEGLVHECGELGVARIVRDHLENFDWLDEAVLYGSFGSGSHRGTSDVDLILVGHADDGALHAAMESLELRLSRDVDYRLYGPQEFDELRRAPGSFVASVLAGPHLVVKRAA